MPALFQSVWSAAGRVFGEEHAFTIRSMANLATVRVEEGNLQEAEKLQRVVLTITQKAVRKTRSDASADPRSEGQPRQYSRYKGGKAESGVLFEDVYNTTTKAFAADAPETIRAMNDYANCLQD
ncbi:hypothetical protein K4K57_007525 [Colletotrichum sp. SAR 10_99]|nr:hypothetical protein K4K57_007525 [Colletotrichum sp. SAR 10_99]